MKSPDQPINENAIFEKKIEMSFWHRCYIYFTGRGIQRNASAVMANYMEKLKDKEEDYLRNALIEDRARLKELVQQSTQIAELEAQLAELRAENERLKRYVNCGYSHVGNTENFVCTKCGYPDS